MLCRYVHNILYFAVWLKCSHFVQASKDHSAELSSQIELLKSQLKGEGDHCTTSGNSLFGEVDDRRMNVERKMISLKVKYESLERNHATATQQLRKLKVSRVK